MKKIIIFSLGIMFLNSSCSDDFTEIIPASTSSENEVFRSIDGAINFLNPAYSGVRNSPWISLENYTNNAIDKSGSQSAAVSGATAESSPVSGEWATAIRNIFQINEFLEKSFDIKGDAFDENFGKALKKRLRGEAFGLRAYYKWVLLKNFAGPSARNPSLMLGIPIIDEVLTIDNANNVARSNYMDSYNNIIKDLDSAYVKINTLRYTGNGDVDGVRLTSRISGEMIWALRARMALYAASNAYKQISWEEAAKIAYEAINVIEGGALVNLQPFGNFNETNDPDHFWRRSYSQNGNLESRHYPPSMFGNGESNPSQNLIDAFPDSMGYPIDHTNSIYSATSPYENRDPRFERFIFYNGQNTYQNAIIEVFTGGKDAPGGINKQATRTGYYLKKFMSENINLDIENTSSSRADYKMYPIFSRGGLYLDFAEAAVEAYGVAGKDGSMVFSAKEAVGMIRSRDNSLIDEYLDIADDAKNTFIDLIRNERRIEFAFEGEYYYDVRRWKLPIGELRSPVMGIRVTKGAEDIFTYELKEVESRNFSERMYYNAIPRTEVLKSNVLIQNHGWE